MIIKQVSVFIENETGSLAHLFRILQDSGINMNAATIADTAEYGIFRCIVQNPEETVEVLKAHNYTASLSQVIAVAIANKTGGLNSVLKLLAAEDIAVRYLYSTIQSAAGQAVIMMKVSDPEKAVDVLGKAGVTMFSLKELE